MARTKKLPPITPGEILSEDFMAPVGLNAHRLALALRVPATRISGIVKGRRAISADTALRLARFFNTSATLWMNLQTNYELRKCEASIRADLERDVTPMAALSLMRIKRSAKRPTRESVR